MELGGKRGEKDGHCGGVGMEAYPRSDVPKTLPCLFEPGSINLLRS